MSKESIHFLNGNFVEEKDLVIPATDLGLTRGYAVFDFFITYRGKPFKLTEHIDRVFNSAKLIGLNLPWTKNQVEEWALQTLDKNNSEEEKMMKIILTGGSGEMVPKGSPTIVITCKPRVRYDDNYYSNGVSVTSVEHLRYTPEAKSNNYIEGVKQMQKAHRKGIFQPIYYDNSQVYEGSNANVFAFIDGVFLTPKNNILKGITRDIVLNELGISESFKEQDFTIEKLKSADEIFLTGSNAEIVPVVSMDELPVGNGEVGEETKVVMEKYKEYTQSDKW